jgi:hypothetical protein
VEQLVEWRLAMTWRRPMRKIHWCCSLSTDVWVLTHRKHMPSLVACLCSLKLTSASWLRPVCGSFHNLIRFNCAPFFASCRRYRVLTVTCLDACRCAAYLTGLTTSSFSLSPWMRIIKSCVRVNIHEVWIGNWIYWTLTLVITNNYNSLTELHTAKDQSNHGTHEVFSVCYVFTSRCLATELNNVLCFRAHVLTGWRLSYSYLLLFCRLRLKTLLWSSYFTTGGLPPVSSPWQQAPWDSRRVIVFPRWTLAVIVLM